MMKVLTHISDLGLLPDSLIRLGIRRMDKKRLQFEKTKAFGTRKDLTDGVIERMNQSPIAVVPQKANEQQTNWMGRYFFSGGIMPSAELWGYRHGNEWIVSHYLLQHANSGAIETLPVGTQTV